MCVCKFFCVCMYICACVCFIVCVVCFNVCVLADDLTSRHNVYQSNQVLVNNLTE